ncbi:MAG: hypothetical protein JWO06_47 [Bacteroidota bacterium]|nr:hypothetical protein [Bacteroidota bacterium]
MKLFVRIGGTVTFIILLVLAILFYKERATFLDLALQNYYFVLYKIFFIPHMRFGGILPQIPPLIVRCFNGSIKEMLLAHSAGFVAFYFAFFAIITFALKNYRIALIFLLWQLLLVSNNFYSISSEIPQGVAFLLLYFAWLEKNNPNHLNRHPVLHFLILLFIQFLHPLLVAPILFVLLYSFYTHYKFDFAKYIAPVLLSLSAFGIRFYAGKFDWYESSKLSIVDALKTNLPSLRHLPSVHKLFHLALGDHLLFWILFGLTLIFLFVEKRYVIGTLLLSFTCGYLLLVCVTNPDADEFYLENMVVPISIFMLLPFTDFVLKKLIDVQPVFILVLLFIISTRLISIYNKHSIYTNRISWYNKEFNIMDKTGENRVFKSDADVPMDTLIMTWASGYESLLLSSINSPDSAKCLSITPDLSAFKTSVNCDTLLVPRWEWPIPKESRNRYFRLTRGYYQIIDK